MRLFVNQDTGALVAGWSQPGPLIGPAGNNSIGLKRRDTPALEWLFGGPFGAAQEIDLDDPITGFRFGAKLPGDFAGDYIVSNWDGATFAYTKTGGSRFADAATTSGSTTLTSATAAFRAAADVGLGIAGAGIPAGATIAAVTDAATAVLSVAATATAADVAITITGRTPVYAVHPVLDTAELTAAFLAGVVTVTVADQAARYALAGLAPGAIVRQADTGELWRLLDPAHAANGAGWSRDVPEKGGVDLAAELEIRQGARVTSTTTFTLRIANDVNRGDEGVPAAANPAYPPAADVAEVVAAYQDGTIGGGSGGAPPATQPEVDAGVNATKPVTPATFAGSAQLAGKQTAAQVDARIQSLIGAAPAALDTLGEIATRLASDESAVGALVTTVAAKATLGTTMGSVVHGSTANVPRPPGYPSVTWIGSVEPVNATPYDEWVRVP